MDTMELKTEPVIQEQKQEKKYKCFNDTYPLCAISLVFAFMYPSRANPLERCILITLIVSFNGGQLFFFTVYTCKCLFTMDIYNFSRNMTLVVILILFFFKTYYVIYATSRFAPFLESMSKDLEEGNNLTEDYQEIYDEHIKQCKVAEISWLIIPTFLTALFPVYPAICMTFKSMQSDDYPRLMVHDMEMMFFEDIQNDWPFFHFYYAYNCIQCVVLVPNYCGLDGSFCIATTHLRMKLKLMTHKLKRAYEDAKTPAQLKALVIESIKDHQDALAFYDALQELYGPWLFAVFMLTSFMISFNLYSLYLLQQLEPKFTMFMIFGVLHIYWPCNYASILAEVGDGIGSEIYSVPWETSKNPEVTKLLIFMIARAQKTLIITGWIVTFNMDLFKSILQTSYSFFTLITA